MYPSCDRKGELVTLHLTVDAPEIYPNNRHEAENAKFLRERTREQSTMLGILRGESPRAANRL